MATQQSIETRLSGLETKMDSIAKQLQQLIDARQPWADLTKDLGPITKAMMDTSVQQLAHLDERGYFAFANEMLYLLDRVVEDYDPADLHALADSAANILDTVKVLTQPAVLAAARDLAEVIAAGEPKPVGALGAVRRIGREKDIQRGLGFALDLLGTIGRSVSRSPRDSRQVADDNERKALPPPTTNKPAPRTPKSTTSKQPPRPVAATHANDTLQFIADEQWGEEYAQRVADQRGVGPLTEAHWVLINFARSDYKDTGSAPNIRRITMQTNVSTREVYRLFPKAPGLAISHIAGVPKPVGCL